MRRRLLAALDGFRLRPARLDPNDALAILDLANEPSVVASRLTGRPVTIREHSAWFEAKLNDTRCRFWLLTRRGKVAGFVRYDRTDDGVAEIDFAVSPHYRGRRLGPAMLLATCRQACEDLRVDVARGTVLISNQASQSAFIKAGFRRARIKDLNGRACVVFEHSRGSRSATQKLSALVVADGGPTVGLGHASRALGLAAGLRSHGWRVQLALPADPDLHSWVAGQQGEAWGSATAAEMTADWVRAYIDQVNPSFVVIDSYAFTPASLDLLAARCPLAYFDDRAQCSLGVDIVVNAALRATKIPYVDGLGTTHLLGPAYQIFRPEFSAVDATRPAHEVRRVLVTVGGGDPANVLGPLARYCETHVLPRYPNICVDVLVGPLVRDYPASRDRLRFHTSTDDLLQLIRSADLAITSGGQILLELARCGRPTLALLHGEDQRDNIQGLAEAGATIPVGDIHDAHWLPRLDRELARVIGDPACRSSVGQTAASLFDGQGASRIAMALEHRLRSMFGARVAKL